jgi:DNA repair protein RadC
MPSSDRTTKSEKARDAAPHFHGHRARLRQRFLQAGSDALHDYEMLELILFRAIPRRDVKPLAKELLEKFGSLAEVIAAPVARLKEVGGLGEAAITDLKIVHAAANRLLRGAVKQRQVLSSWSNVLDYCRAAMGFESKEHFRILFLDKGNHLIAIKPAPSTTRRSIRARWSSARSSLPPPRSSWCTIIPPATPRPHAPTSR